MKRLLSLVLLVLGAFASGTSYGQAAEATLSGSPSQGNGVAKVTLDGMTLKTDIYFGRLDAPSTAAYVLCCNQDRFQQPVDVGFLGQRDPDLVEPLQALEQVAEIRRALHIVHGSRLHLIQTART